MIIRIVTDCFAWGIAAWLATLLRFGPAGQGDYLFARLSGFVVLGMFWVACRGAAYWTAGRLRRRWVSVLLTLLCPIATLAFCGAVSYVLFMILIGRGVLLLMLIIAGYVWGLISEAIFDPTKYQRHRKVSGQ